MATATSSLPISDRRETDQAPLLTVIVPAFNEEKTIDVLLKRLIDGPYPFPAKEVIVVDDGSTDRTSAILEKWRGEAGVTCLRHVRNQGKGTAIRSALEIARGDITIIQDADLEYDPRDIPKLVELIRRGESQIVFGSRYLSQHTLQPWTVSRLAVSMLNWGVRLLYGPHLSDEATCYKAIRTQTLQTMKLRCRRFEFCPEVTAKACRLNLRIVEVPISYQRRLSCEGKKIGFSDGLHAIWTLVRWRFAPIG